ncbi:MAG: Fe-S cluster assembly protein SufD [Flavobacteriales bacterium]|nr:Fe-S cluster assembly protein SufD [Flavobacteriales bacterium]|tara:strand:- start:489 stop:1799 length:1311 start_codon:yes stop_codon:yes gene_type:complete
MATLTLNDKDRFLINQEGQDFSHEAKTFIKIRELALKNLKELDFPSKKLEDWKYTNVREVSKTEFRPQSAINIIDEKISAHKIPNLNAYVLVFVNGFFAPKYSNTIEQKESGFIITNLNKAKKDFIKLVEPHLGFQTRAKDQFFVNLNSAFSQDGGFIYVKPNVQLDKPIHIINLVDGDLVASYPRNLIIAEKCSEVQVIVSYETIDSNSALSNVINEVVVGEGANVKLDKIQNENLNTFHVGADFAKQQKNSVFTINTIPANAKLIRNNLNIILDGTNSVANLYGAVCLNGNIHVDNQTYVDHAKPNCESNELYKAVLNDSATNVFNGKIYVNKIAQKTNAFQSNANIILSDNASSNAKPQLEIYADDVKCSHGCTIGQFDDEALFYLRSRGMRESTAQKVLLDAFIGEVLDNIKTEPVREYVDELIAENFNSLN